MIDSFENARVARAYAAERSYGDPSQDMHVVGITGTNGKTTTVHLVAAIMQHAQRSAYALGTINSALTTLGEPELAQTLAALRDKDIEVVAMEVSSHGLAQHRADAVHFDVTAFSNLTQDHLDYHKDMDEYLAAKKRLFFDLESAVSVINVATPVGAALADEIALHVPDRRLITVGVPGATVYAHEPVHVASATTFDLVVDGNAYEVALPLVGAHNVDNALLAAGCAYGSGVDPVTIAEALSCAPQVPGRLQRVAIEGRSLPYVFVDYAHTPDALEHALGSLRAITPGALTVVFGCGGDRDRGKRPLMGRIAADTADKVIITTDNPRSEDPAAIIADIWQGIHPDAAPELATRTMFSDDDGSEADSGSTVSRIIDRAQAIQHAIEDATETDTVLIAGKGHETYQVFADKTIDFDDVKVAQDALSHRTDR